MKRTFAKLLSLFVVLALVIAMVPAVFAVDGTVSAGKTLLNVNEETTISVTDANGTAVSNVALSSDHDDIVSISGMTITAQKVGSATITATVKEDGETQTLGSVTITVQSGVSAIAADTSVEIDVDSLATASLSVKLTGAASGDVLAVQSSDESVVTVPASVDASTDSCSVTLTAVKTGTAAVTLNCGTATAQNGYTPYQQSVQLTWNAYKKDVADLGGSKPGEAMKTTTSSGSSSVTLYTYATGTSKTAVQVPVTVSVTISGTTYQASPLSVSVSPASAPSFAVHEEDYFDPDDFSEAVDGATGRYAGKLSAITIEGSNGGSVYENGSRVSSSTKYYVSGTRNKLISSLYFRTSSTSTTNAYFTYIGYDADGDVIAAGKVTLGDERVDMEYSASFGGSVTFLESDFSKAFSGKAGEKLDYVTFAMNRATVVMNNKTYSLNDGSNAAIFGWAYTTSKATTKLSSTDKCYYQASYTQLDLDEITYVTGSYRTKYTVYLPYTAVGTSGSRYEGYTAITVSGDDSITASGASMKTLGAADAVLRAYPNAAYVMFKQPAVSEGRLLYNFRSVAAQNYTAVDYSKDQFYLSGTSAKNLYLDSVFFLPAADCSTQIRLAFTVYGTSGTQLGSGELTVRVASKTASSVFSDVNARTCSWAANAVDFMNEYGLVKGTGTSTFGWKGSMTRGDFVLILYRNAGSPSVYGVSNPFTDVKSTDYYYEAVLWAYRNNVVNGTSTTTFGPKGKITREQIASILWRLAGKPVYSASLRSYTDYASVSDYAYDAMSWAVGSGYVKGSGAKLSPKNNATRAEVAVMLHRYLTK